MAPILFDKVSLTTANEEDIRNFKGKKDRPALSEAARLGRLDCCEVILERFPELILGTNDIGSTALHEAASKGHVDIIKFLLQQKDGLTLLMKENRYKYTSLHDAAEDGKLDAVRALIEADDSLEKKLLTKKTEDDNTALHFAVKRNHFQILEYLVEKSDPNYIYPMNKNGHTPLFWAWNKAFLHPDEPINATIRKRLVELQPAECKLQSDPSKLTLLHYAAQKGDINAVDEILQNFPEGMGLVDSYGRNFVHAAAQYKQEHLMNHIVDSDIITTGVLNAIDKNGKTPLHIATSTGEEGVILPLLYSPKVKKTIEDKHGRVAIASINFYYDKIKSGVYNNKDLMTDKELNEQSAFDLLVAALICTVSFTSGIMVPGGFVSSGSQYHEGNAILYRKNSFLAFVISNSMAFALSLYVVFSHFSIKHLRSKKDIIFQLRLAMICIFGSIFALMASFISGSFAVFGVHHKPAFTACVVCFICFFVLAVHPIWLMTWKQRQNCVRCVSKEEVNTDSSGSSATVQQP